MDDEAIPKALGDYGRLVTVEMHLINEQLQASMGQIVAESAAQGLLNSGATMSRLASEAANTVPVRTQVAMQLMIRCFAAHGVAVNSSNRGIVVERLHQFIENYRVQLRSTVQRTAPFKGPLKHQAAEDQVLRYIDLKANLEKQRIEGEINLVVAASQRQSSDGASPMTGPVFNGPVGLVQLGSNNVGTNHQNLGPDGQKALSDAFAKLIVALEASPQGLSLDVAEVKDVLMKKYGAPRSIVTDRLRAYSAAIKEIGAADRHEVGGRLNNRAENSHQPFRRRERAMQRFRSMKTLQKFSSVHAQVQNHFNQEWHLIARQVYKQRRSIALAEWRGLAA